LSAKHLFLHCQRRGGEKGIEADLAYRHNLRLSDQPLQFPLALRAPLPGSQRVQTRRRPGAADRLRDTKDPSPSRPIDAGDDETPDARQAGSPHFLFQILG
jgi:hypothetical protein